MKEFGIAWFFLHVEVFRSLWLLENKDFLSDLFRINVFRSRIFGLSKSGYNGDPSRVGETWPLVREEHYPGFSSFSLFNQKRMICRDRPNQRKEICEHPTPRWWTSRRMPMSLSELPSPQVARE